MRAVRTALDHAARHQEGAPETAALVRRFELLTPRGREVMSHVATGKLNKQIAADLGTGEHNIKIHRGRVMQKMGICSAADPVRAVERLGV
ncbi:MAG: hypothetical protein JWM59_1940 [Verrucomicrobiales bacterium]|nr:hypothetical protein [Verrucomicrobiales bacterium]